MSKDPRITSNSDGHFEPAVERYTEHKGKAGPDFIGEWQKQMGIRDRDDAVRFYSETLRYGRRMYEMGLAAAQASAGEAYREALNAASGAARNIVIIGAPEDSPFPEGIADAILHLPIPEKWEGRDERPIRT